jgi:hypothetical protein
MEFFIGIFIAANFVTLYTSLLNPSSLKNNP